jgi:NTE family protein
MVTVGLVLSGGGSRGLAQIGILKVLSKNGIKADIVAGTSIGALIGACYSFDMNIEKIENMLVKMMNNKLDFYDYTFSTKGLIKGEKLEKALNGYFSDRKRSLEFEDLKIPIRINATDIVNGKEIVFDKGPLIPAVMASLSYPGFFTIRKVKDNLCVDGGVINPLPISLIPDADYLILVDVSEEDKRINEESNMKDVVIQATLIMQKAIVEKDIVNCNKKHILIRPNLSYRGLFDFDHPKDVIDLGEKEGIKHVEQIKKDIEELRNAERTGSINIVRT